MSHLIVMEDLNSFQLAEDRLAAFEIVNLPTYDRALTSVTSDVESEIADLVKEISLVQADLSQHFADNSLTDLKTEYRVGST